MQKWEFGILSSMEPYKEPFKISRGPRTLVQAYAVQCETCLKWRTISSKEEFEEIRSKHTEEPFFCNKKPNVSCEDPADIEYDSSRTWVMDKPNLPKTPTGFQREVVLRKNFSKMDVHYVTPDGKKIRASTEITNLLKEHPEYKLSISDFSFTSPRVMGETVPGYVERKGSTSGNKKLKTATQDA